MQRAASLGPFDSRKKQSQRHKTGVMGALTLPVQPRVTRESSRCMSQFPTLRETPSCKRAGSVGLNSNFAGCTSVQNVPAELRVHVSSRQRKGTSSNVDELEMHCILDKERAAVAGRDRVIAQA